MKYIQYMFKPVLTNVRVWEHCSCVTCGSKSIVDKDTGGYECSWCNRIDNGIKAVSMKRYDDLMVKEIKSKTNLEQPLVFEKVNP